MFGNGGGFKGWTCYFFDIDGYEHKSKTSLSKKTARINLIKSAEQDITYCEDKFIEKVKKLDKMFRQLLKTKEPK